MASSAEMQPSPAPDPTARIAASGDLGKRLSAGGGPAIGWSRVLRGACLIHIGNSRRQALRLSPRHEDQPACPNRIQMQHRPLTKRAATSTIRLVRMDRKVDGQRAFPPGATASQRRAQTPHPARDLLIYGSAKCGTAKPPQRNGTAFGRSPMRWFPAAPQLTHTPRCGWGTISARSPPKPPIHSTWLACLRPPRTAATFAISFFRL